MTSKTYLEYAPTTDRFVRIFWPHQAGFPTWKVVWVADWPEQHADWIEEPMGFSPLWKDGGETWFRLEAPRCAQPASALVLQVLWVRTIWLFNPHGDWPP